MAQSRKVQKSEERVVREPSSANGLAWLKDNRREIAVQRKLQQGMAEHGGDENTAQLRKSMQDVGSGASFPIQRKSNRTGLPDNLKSGIENLSGFAMDDVKVHYNSNKPAQLQAHAYAQGTDIHLAPGQEKHLGHEAWHVVQQKQGRVKPTRQLKSKVNINDDTGLEKEADVMGAKALRNQPLQRAALSESGVSSQTVQMERYEELVDKYDGSWNNGRVLVIEVNMAGSANAFLDPGDEDRNITWTHEENDKRLAHSRRPATHTNRYFREQIEFEGPGGPNTTGMGSRAKGGSDSGSNSTKRLKKFVPQYVDDLVNQTAPEQFLKTVVIITAHSRGAVAAYHVAQGIKHQHSTWHVELAQFDPVPGPGQKKSNKEGHRPKHDDFVQYGPLATPLDDHTVVYSVASGWLRGFTPMQLHTMKRLVITQEGHSAGIGKVYFYKGKEYEKSELNALPPGVYVEVSLGNRGQLILNSATSIEDAKRMYQEAAASSKSKSDVGRQRIVYKAINAFSWGS